MEDLVATGFTEFIGNRSCFDIFEMICKLKIVVLILPPSQPTPRGEGVRNLNIIDIISTLGEIRKGV
jgi:hypothetical protein